MPAPVAVAVAVEQIAHVLPDYAGAHGSQHAGAFARQHVVLTPHAEGFRNGDIERLARRYDVTVGEQFGIGESGRNQQFADLIGGQRGFARMRIVERSEAVALDLQQGLAFGDLLRRQVSAEGVAAARHRHRSRLGVHGLHFGILGRGRQREDGFRAHVLHRHGVIGQLVGVRDEGFGQRQLMAEHESDLAVALAESRRAGRHEVGFGNRSVVDERRRIGIFGIGIIGIEVHDLPLLHVIGFGAFLTPRTVGLTDEFGILDVVARSGRIGLRLGIGADHGEEADGVPLHEAGGIGDVRFALGPDELRRLGGQTDRGARRRGAGGLLLLAGDDRSGAEEQSRSQQGSTAE